jgi:hypothetical protein
MTSTRSQHRCAGAVALTVTVVLGFLLLPAAASAQDRKALMATGSSQRKAGDDLGALSSFLRAHALGPTPETFAQIGTCEFALNRFVEAEIHLAEAMKASQDPWVRKNHVALQEYVASTKAMLGWVEIVGTPAGADVEVGGRPVGHLPLPGRVRVAAGEVNIRMDAPGFKVYRQDVEVTADEVRRVNIDLVPLNAAEPSKIAQAKIGQLGGRRGAGSSTIDTDVTAGPGPGGGSSSASTYRTAGWVTAGGGVVLLTAGVAALVIKESSTQEFNDYMKNDPVHRCNEASPGKGGPNCATLLDRSQTAKVIGYSAIAGAALAGVVSVILLSANPAEAVAQLGPGASPEASRADARKLARSGPQLRCAPSLLQLGGACAMTF